MARRFIGPAHSSDAELRDYVQPSMGTTIGKALGNAAQILGSSFAQRMENSRREAAALRERRSRSQEKIAAEERGYQRQLGLADYRHGLGEAERTRKARLREKQETRDQYRFTGQTVSDIAEGVLDKIGGPHKGGMAATHTAFDSLFKDTNRGETEDLLKKTYGRGPVWEAHVKGLENKAKQAGIDALAGLKKETGIKKAKEDPRIKEERKRRIEHGESPLEYIQSLIAMATGKQPSTTVLMGSSLTDEQKALFGGHGSRLLSIGQQFHNASADDKLMGSLNNDVTKLAEYLLNSPGKDGRYQFYRDLLFIMSKHGELEKFGENQIKKQLSMESASDYKGKKPATDALYSLFNELSIPVSREN